MLYKFNIVFFGTYVSTVRGSKSPGETIADSLTNIGHETRMISRRSSTVTRVIQWFWGALTVRSDVVVLDIFSSRVLYVSSCIAYIIALRRIPIIVILHGGALLERYNQIEAVLAPILDRASRIVSPSGFLSEGFKTKGYDVEHIPNPLRLERFPFRQRNRPHLNIRLLWVRAFAEIYRPHWPVEIVWHLHRRRIPCRLTMIGPDRGLLDMVFARAHQLGVTKYIEYAGFVPNNELSKYYHSHDYLLNTTQFESFGVALTEAASTGLPIVSAAVGEVKYSWKDDEDIFLVYGETSEEFANRIADLRESDADASKYRHISRTARAKVEEYSLESIMPRWETMIRQICDGRSN
jgi:glycosyltransferase involved in cell wall biosynthesis